MKHSINYIQDTSPNMYNEFRIITGHHKYYTIPSDISDISKLLAMRINREIDEILKKQLEMISYLNRHIIKRHCN